VTNLLDLAIAGHGGRRRWEQFSRFSASVAITGAIRALPGWPGLLDDVALEGDTRVPHLTITPFPRPGEFLTWERERLRINEIGGRLVVERVAPTAAARPGAWDECQVATLAAEANWHCFVAPFIFTNDDVDTEETWPWREDAQIWRALLVTYPDPMVMHSRRQTYYFDDAGLVRRLDYDLNFPGGGPAVHYPSRYREFDGILVPTHRAVYARDPDGDPDRSRMSVDIEISNVTFR
jgi:hypothetical protein